MKKKKDQLTEREYIRTLDMLYTAASSIKGRSAVKQFLRDLLTRSERIMLGRRIWIARLLMQGVSYDAITAKLKVGMGTIQRVDRWLKDQFPGFEQAIEGLEKEMDRRALKREARADHFSLAALKKKYPLHFLLFPNPKPSPKYRD